METTQILTCPSCKRLQVVLDQEKVVAGDPGADTPAMVYLRSTSGAVIASATLWCAVDTGVLDSSGKNSISLPESHTDWLNKMVEKANAFLYPDPAKERLHPADQPAAQPIKPKPKPTADEIRLTLPQFYASEGFTRLYPNLVLTDGALYVAEAAGAYWLMDIIWSYLPKTNREEFQVWTLSFPDPEKSAALVVCDDGNGHELVRQAISYGDFPLKEVIKLYACANELGGFTIMLPNEY